MPDYMSEFNDDFEYKNEPDETIPDDAENAGIALKNTRLLKKYIEDLVVNGNLILNVKGIQSINIFDSERWYKELNDYRANRIYKDIIDGKEYYRFSYDTIYLYHFMEGEFKENTQYTLKFIGRNKDADYVCTGFQINYTDGTHDNFDISAVLVETEHKFVSKINKTISYISLLNVRGNEVLVRNIMMYEGTDDKEYSPYFKI